MQIEESSARQILDAIQNLRREVEEDIHQLAEKFDDAVRSHYELKERISEMRADLNARVGQLDSNTSDLWTALHEVERKQAENERVLLEHVNKSVGQAETRKTAFAWTNLITPIVVTVGLAIIGWMIAAK